MQDIDVFASKRICQSYEPIKAFDEFVKKSKKLN